MKKDILKLLYTLVFVCIFTLVSQTHTLGVYAIITTLILFGYYFILKGVIGLKK